MRTRTTPDVEPIVKYLASKGGQVNGVHAGNVTNKIASFIGVPSAKMGPILRRMEKRGLIQVDRGTGGRFIYGIKLLIDPETGLKHYERIYGSDEPEISLPASATADWDKQELRIAQGEFQTIQMQSTSMRTANSGLEDYSVLAGKLLEKAIDAIAENERLRERIAYLEGKVAAQRPITLDEQRRNVVKELLHQVGEDVNKP